MFTRPFDSTASSAATGYDSALNLFTAFPGSDVAASPMGNSDPTHFTGLNPQFLNQSSQAGRFTVGNSGELQLDYLFDGGGYQGELALFNLSGLESLEPGSTAFIQEAARRSLSGSDLGYVLIRDQVEGAKFSGMLTDVADFNAGSYLGTKRFALTPGTEFGLMLVPNGTVQQMFDNPGLEGTFHPLFSWASANSGSTIQLGQMSDQGQGASIFAWEDLQVNVLSDRDFNDFVFRLDGAIGSVPTLDEDVSNSYWRIQAAAALAMPTPLDLALAVGNGWITNQSMPMIVGLAVPGTMVSLYANEMLVGKGQTGLDGTWQVISSPLADGSYNLTAKARNTLGLVSQSSVSLEITVDTTAPQSPQIMISPNGATWHSQSHFSVTYPNPTISGTTEAENLVQFYQDGTLIAQPTVDANGDWYWTTSSLVDGTYTFTANATDAAGNRSQLSEPLTITVDATVPAAPTIQLLASSDTGISNSDFITYDNTPTFTGTAEPNTIVQVWVNDTIRETLPVGSNGLWTCSPDLFVPNNSFDNWLDSDGGYRIYATAVDQAGNVSAISKVLMVMLDTLPPYTPTVQLTEDSDPAFSNLDGMSRSSTLQLNGIADTDSLVQLLVNGEFAGQATVGWDGTWQTTLSPLTDGTYQITAATIDIAGNMSLPSAPLMLTIDTQIPTPPTNLRVAGLTNSSFIGSNPPRVNGNAQPDTGIKLFSDGQLIGQTTAAWNGTWSIVSDTVLAEGLQIFTATSTDAAGNESPESEPLSITIDTTAPYFYLSDLLEGYPLSTEARLVGYADGTFSPLATLEYQFDNLPPISVLVNSDGTFNQLLDFTGVENGAHALILRAFDQAGIGTSRQFDVITDTVPPDITAPVIVASLNRSTVSGEANAVQITSSPVISGFVTDEAAVTVFQAGFDNLANNTFTDIKPLYQTDGSFSLDGNQLNAIYGDTLPDGVHTLHLQAQDEFGNFSDTTLTFTLDTTAPDLMLVSVANQDTLGDEARLTGQVLDMGAAVSVSYQFDQQASVPVILAADGWFDQAFDFAGVENGIHTLTLTATDAVGNITTNTVTVTTSLLTTTASTISARLSRDTGGSAADGVTTDPTIIATINQARVASVWGRFEGNAETSLVDLTKFVATDGTLLIDSTRLEAIFDGELLDGEQAVLLQARAATGATVATVRVPFKLDRTAPIVSVVDLLDGISWEEEAGQSVQGSVLNFEPGTSVVYYVDGNEQAALPLVVGGSGEFTGLIPLSGLPLGTHHLSIRGTDLAGNQQTGIFPFQLKQDELPEDTDVDTAEPPTGGGTGGGGTGGTGGAGGGYGNNGGGGGYWWMNWGGGGTSGGGGNPPPDFGGGTPAPDMGYGTEEPDIPYLERIKVILDQANRVMPFGNRRAALRNRRNVLLEAAKAIDQGQLYNEVGPALYGIFMFANQFKKKSQAERIGTYLGRELLDAKDAAVKVQVFQSSLLTAVEQTLKEKSITPTLTEQQQVTKAVMQLAETYARFDPPKEAAANGVIPNLLNLLWRAQYDKQADLLDDAVLGLKDLLLNVAQPMQAVQFLSNLLKVAATVVGLGDDLKDPLFLKKLVEFGGKYAKLNPDTSLSAQPQGFLDELWRSPLDDAAALKRAGAGLSDFFEGATTREQLLKRLEFGGNLLEAAKLAPATQEQVTDPQFVDALLGLGQIYAALDPDETGAGEETDFFLNTLYEATGEQDIQKGAQELESFFNAFMSWQGGEEEIDPDDPNTKGLSEVNQFTKEVKYFSKYIEKALEDTYKYGKMDGLRAIQARLDKIKKNYIPHSNPEGSGPHGVPWRKRNLDDYFLYTAIDLFTKGALATGIGAGILTGKQLPTDAARHLRHYIGNSGKFLTIDAQNLYENSKDVQNRVNAIKKEVLERARSGPTNIDYEIKSPHRSGYVVKEDSWNWFLAIGGYQYWYTAKVKTGSVRSIDVQIHIKDTYNWDQNKKTPILGLTFSDKTLGTLHQAGMAKEYPLGGSLFFTWNY